MSGIGNAAAGRGGLPKVLFKIGSEVLGDTYMSRVLYGRSRLSLRNSNG